MNRADLAGLCALALAYFLGAAQASTLAQVRAYAVLALMLAAYGVAVALLSRVPIERLYRVGVYTSLRLERAASLVKRLRAQIQAQRNTDNRYHASALAKLNERLATATKERDEAQQAAEFWQYQARSGTEDDKLSVAFSEINRLMGIIDALTDECEGLKRASGRRKEDRPS
jgi:hypothetical protein